MEMTVKIEGIEELTEGLNNLTAVLQGKLEDPPNQDKGVKAESGPAKKPAASAGNSKKSAATDSATGVTKSPTEKKPAKGAASAGNQSDDSNEETNTDVQEDDEGMTEEKLRALAGAASRKDLQATRAIVNAYGNSISDISPSDRPIAAKALKAIK